MSVRRSCLALAVAMLGAVPQAAEGTFALQTGSPKTRAFLEATSGTSADSLSLDLDFWMARDRDTRALTAYDVDMTKRLHLIIVSADFAWFAHVHPTLGADGHFRIAQRFPKAGSYEIYADADPHGFGKQVFRFQQGVGEPASSAQPELVPSGPVSRAGPYVVTLDRTTLATGGETAIAVHVRRDGKPATDLHPYLGALAHAVFLDSADLTYAHVHPMPLGSANHMSGMAGMPGMGAPATPIPANALSSPDMLLHVAVREPGRYKLWLQFRGGSALEVAPFVLTAR